jgi:hypothetical protein
MDQIMHILAEHFVNVLVSQSAEAGRVAERASVFEINSINGFGGRVEEQSKFVLALAQCLFRPFALGDVRHHSYHPQQLSLLVEEGSRAFLQPNSRTIGMQHAIANVRSRVLWSNLVNQTDKQCAVFWINTGQQLVTGKPFRPVAETKDIRCSSDRMTMSVATSHS